MLKIGIFGKICVFSVGRSWAFIKNVNFFGKSLVFFTRIGLFLAIIGHLSANSWIFFDLMWVIVAEIGYFLADFAFLTISDNFLLDLCHLRQHMVFWATTACFFRKFEFFFAEIGFLARIGYLLLQLSFFGINLGSFC